MLISKDEMQKRRTPQELLEYVECAEKAVASLSATDSEFERAKRQQGDYKKFIKEIRPLSWFAVKQYPNTYTVQPELSNDGFDAIVFDDTGKEHERIEMTFPHDGQEVRLDAEDFLKTKRAKLRGFKPESGYGFDELLPFVERTCRNKARKDYSSCTIVVFVAVWPPLAGFEGQWECQLKKMTGCLSGIQFKAKRVFLLLGKDRVEQIA